ncbi:uncharacterized protein LOC125253351 isoform X1 [Megalobrama amblycephala]|uniref:uncharacterized protein LOC125253351 isoform X1 n=1 Tax=Megalobrama amblycephala TaxID=75352 RepID=UPI002013DC8A|nr:uncharacterized protein LOC125253351 isoform X1 [Megalobrama amblycephala]
MKAYKSLEAYNFFVNGWVHNLGVKRLHDDHRLIFAGVNHSQRSSETPLKTWIIAKEAGEVIAAHCNCMAGLSESCSHVGAVLFSIEVGVKMRDSASCTTEQCKWLMPSHVKKIPAAPVALIDFSSAKAKKIKLDRSIDGRTTDNKVGKSLPCPRVKRGYGCKHEAQARGAYEKLMVREHAGFSCMDSGLWLNPKWPYMGSSPDGIVACDCHGTGICEIKCPHSHQDEANLRMCAGEKSFCLINDGDNVKLDRSHDYYYQVQAQLHIVGAEYCDFVVWNCNDIFVERILPDFELWDDVIPKVECFFRNCLLPEILGQQVTNLHV